MGAANKGIRMKRFYMDALESWRIEGQQSYAQTLTAKDMSIFIKDIVQ